MLDNFLNDNTMKMRLIRTIFEGVLSVLVVSVPIIVGWLALTPEMASMLTALIMCVITPILSMLRTKNPEDALKDKE